MKRTIVITLAIMVLGAAALLGACGQVDVILKYSRESLDKLIGQFPDVTSETDNGYAISVDDETVLQISSDFSAGTDDIVFSTPIKPFTYAGMDVSKLGEGLSADDNTLYITTDYGDADKADSAADALFAAAAAKRDALSYHTALDHYGFDLTAGKFEYAKDYKTNDKDIVFVLKSGAIADSGANINNIQGWAFVTMDDGAEVLVKPYDLG